MNPIACDCSACPAGARCRRGQSDHSAAESAASDCVPSPCIGVCRIDPATGWCAGCFRQLEEISAWPSLSDSGKRLALARVAQRRAQALAESEHS